MATLPDEAISGSAFVYMEKNQERRAYSGYRGVPVAQLQQNPVAMTNHAHQVLPTRILLTLLIVTCTFVTAHATYPMPGELSTEKIFPDRQPTITLSGTVVDRATGTPLPGANLVVAGRVTGTATRADGSFSLTAGGEPPITILVSLVGFHSREIEITSAVNEGLLIELEERILLGSDVVVSASRVEESFMAAPV